MLLEVFSFLPRARKWSKYYAANIMQSPDKTDNGVNKKHFYCALGKNVLSPAKW